MPIYEYDCHHCKKTIEAIQKVDESPLLACPHCSRPGLKKRTSLNSFQLKGAGWYRDGYGGRNPDSAESKKSDSAVTADAKSDSSSKSPAA